MKFNTNTTNTTNTAMTPEIAKLIEEARFACGETRAQCGGSSDPDESQPPTWLAALEAAVAAVESAEFDDCCPRCGGVMVEGRCDCSPGGTL